MAFTGTALRTAKLDLTLLGCESLITCSPLVRLGDKGQTIISARISNGDPALDLTGWVMGFEATVGDKLIRDEDQSRFRLVDKNTVEYKCSNEAHSFIGTANVAYFTLKKDGTTVTTQNFTIHSLSNAETGTTGLKEHYVSVIDDLVKSNGDAMGKAEEIKDLIEKNQVVKKSGDTMSGDLNFNPDKGVNFTSGGTTKNNYLLKGQGLQNKIALQDKTTNKWIWEYNSDTNLFSVLSDTNLYKKTGDTMTGDLGVQIPTSGANGISFKSTTGSDIHKWIGTNSGAVAWQDKLANLDVMNYSSASKSLTLMNGIVFNVNGETNLVKKTGDTMTGTLEIRKPSPVVELTIPNGSKKVKLLYNAGDTADYGFQISTPTGKAFLRTEGESTIREIATKEKDGRAELTLTADATNNSESYKPLAVRRGNTVTVRMEITRKEGSTNNLVCTLPEGMRPIETLTQTFIAQDGTPVTVNVSYTGNVEVYTTGKRVKIVYTYVAD